MSAQMSSSANFIRVSFGDPCTACGSHRGCTYTRKNGRRYSICLRNKETTRFARDGRAVHTTTDDGSNVPYEPARPIAATIDRRHAVYTEMLKRLTLDDVDRDSLVARGMSAEMIEDFGYKTTADIANHLADIGYILDRVPGFYKEGDDWRMNVRPGFFIPVRDAQGRIQALQMRCREGTRYKWFSSYYCILPDKTKQLLPSGASSGCPVHHRAGEGSTVWVCEGPLKGDVLWKLSGHSVLAIAGVDTGHADVAAATLNFDKAVIAFDMDFVANPAIRRAMVKLYQAIQDRSGISVSIALWEGYKGVDDALLGGVTQFPLIPFSKDNLEEVAREYQAK